MPKLKFISQKAFSTPPIHHKNKAKPKNPSLPLPKTKKKTFTPLTIFNNNYNFLVDMLLPVSFTNCSTGINPTILALVSKNLQSHELQFSKTFTA